jgi:hypothetical protein
MNIESFKSFKTSLNFIEEMDENGRNIGYCLLQNVCIVGRNYFYPNVLFYNYDLKNLTSPYDEKIMSLNKDSFYDDNIFHLPLNVPILPSTEINVPVFFFIYNFDNYYHFLYDTIPYLYTFHKIKQFVPELKLLVNYPNPEKNGFYKFNIDLLEKYVPRENWMIHRPENNYKTIYISTSLTHGGLSNLPPRKEVFDLYHSILPKVKSATVFSERKNESIPPNFERKLPTYDYIYISRRTWINGDTSNIGTNYTTRRKMINEDILVEKLLSLKQYNIQEIFAENLSIDEKIHLFRNAKVIIGSIGGGMSNLLFSNEKTHSIVILTPDFLNINNRFKYSMEHTQISYFEDVEVYKEKNDIPLYTRVKVRNQIGEIVEYNCKTDQYLVNISNNDVAGFNNDISFKQEYFSREEMILLDKGLNSPYIVDCENLINLITDKIDENTIIKATN